MKQQKLSRREFLRIGALTTSAAFLASCAPKATETAAPAATQAAVTAPAVNKGGTLRVYWNPGHGYDAYKEVIAQFEKDNPGWTVNWEMYQWPDMRTKLLANFAAGDVPDLVEESNWTQEFAVQGHVLPLDSFIEKDGQAMGFPGDWQERAVTRNQVNGETFGIQLHLTCALPFYNKDMFTAAGIQNPPTTWEEVVETCKATTKDNVFGIALNQSQEYSWFWNAQNDVHLFDTETQTIPMDNDLAYEALQYQADLVHVHKVAPVPIASADYEGPQKLFSARRAALIITGPWDIKPILTSSPDINWGIAAPLTRKVQATYAAGTGMFIPKKAQNPELAWELLKRFVDLKAEVAATKEANMLMPRKSWAADPEILGMERVAPFAKYIPIAEDWSAGLRLTGKTGAVLDLYTKAYQEALYKNTPASDALKEFVANANKVIAEG